MPKLIPPNAAKKAEKLEKKAREKIDKEITRSLEKIAGELNKFSRQVNDYSEVRREIMASVGIVVPMQPRIISDIEAPEADINPNQQSGGRR